MSDELVASTGRVKDAAAILNVIADARGLCGKAEVDENHFHEKGIQNAQMHKIIRRRWFKDVNVRVYGRLRGVPEIYESKWKKARPDELNVDK